MGFTALPVIWALPPAMGFCAIAYRVGALSLSGFFAAVILGAVILAVGGWLWALPLVMFFMTSSLLSQARSRNGMPTEEARGSRRDAMQILANGGIAGLCAISYALGLQSAQIAFVAALAAANADTWSTEIGILLGRNPRSIVSGRPVTPGTSGGVTIIGLLASAMGAALIAWTGLWAVPLHGRSRVWIVIALAGFSGSLIDSLLGATLQERRKCPICFQSTEKSFHCGQRTQHVGGLRILTNDGVNFCCTACGALCALGLIQIIR